MLVFVAHLDIGFNLLSYACHHYTIDVSGANLFEADTLLKPSNIPWYSVDISKK